MDASEEEWVNFENQLYDRMIALRTTLALVVLGVNPLFLGGLYITYIFPKDAEIVRPIS